MMGKRRWELGVCGQVHANQCCFGHGKFEMSISHTSEKVREAVGYMILELRVMMKAEI